MRRCPRGGLWSMSGRAGRRRATRRSGARGTSKRRGRRRKTGACRHSADNLLAKMEESLDVFQYEAAVKFGLQAVEQEPKAAHVLEGVGPVLLELGRTDEAWECLQRAVQVRPESGHLKYLYLGQMSSGEEAVAYLSKAIEIMTRELEAGEGAGGEGAGGGGGDSLRGVEGDGARGADGDSVRGVDVSGAYCSLAEVFLTDSCFSSDAEQQCHDSCQKAVQYAPDNPEAHQLMASCLLSMSRLEEAKAAIQRSLSLWLPISDAASDDGAGTSVMCGGGTGDSVTGDGTTVPPYFSRIACAKILMELQLHEEAYSVLEQLLRDDDEVVVVWYLMGWLHTLTHDSDSARFYLEQARKLASKSDCDDDEMVQHIRELLDDLGKEGEEEGGGDEVEKVAGESEGVGEEARDCADPPMDVS